MTGCNTARQRETARWYERRAQIDRLVKDWHDAHKERWEPWPELVQATIRTAVRELAHEAVESNLRELRLTPFGKPRFDAMMRCLVSQVRLKRFGPLHENSAQQWQQQINEIAAELGWQWIDSKERALPIVASTHEAKAA